MRVLAISGSLQATSNNRRLLLRAAQLAPPGMTVVVYSGLAQLPHFNPDLGDGPASVAELRAAVDAADALLIACPEYGFSLPGSLKNAVDWLIGTGELEEQRIAVTASTPSPERGHKGLAALLGTLAAVRAQVVGGQPIARGAGEDDALRALLEELAGG